MPKSNQLRAKTMAHILSFTSIALISMEEKRAQTLVGKLNKKKERNKEDRIEHRL